MLCILAGGAIVSSRAQSKFQVTYKLLATRLLKSMNL
jgi:hypothetical protein